MSPQLSEAWLGFLTADVPQLEIMASRVFTYMNEKFALVALQAGCAALP